MGWEGGRVAPSALPRPCPAPALPRSCPAPARPCPALPWPADTPGSSSSRLPHRRAAAAGAAHAPASAPTYLPHVPAARPYPLAGATGRRLEESKKINQSLSALGNVIAALTNPRGRDGRPHVPYRRACSPVLAAAEWLWRSARLHGSRQSLAPSPTSLSPRPSPSPRIQLTAVPPSRPFFPVSS